MIRDLVARLGGQVKWATGGEKPVAMGWDMTAALSLAGALGIPALLAAEFLPPIEAAAMAAMNSDGQDLEAQDD